jgi:hypothetical protein
MKPMGALVTAVAVLLGVLGNLLLRAPADPGINFPLWALLVALGLFAVQRHTGRALDMEARLLLGAGLLLMAGMAWRDAAALKTLALLCGVVAFALPAWRSGVAWVTRGSVGEVVGAVASGVAHGAAGALLLLRPAEWPDRSVGAGARGSARWRTAGAALRGLLLAAPFLVIFGALFMAADAVFAQFIADTLRFDLDTVASHVLFTAVLSWIVAGYLRGFAGGTNAPVRVLDPVLHTPRIGMVELGVALVLIQVVFAAFIIVQFRYLFGGAMLIEVTPGLTYAEYARRGFFELVFGTLLVLPMLLAADAVRSRERAVDDIVFRTLAGIQIVLVAAVMLSAVRRLGLYIDAYGLTAQRFYAAALLALLGVLLLWFCVTVLRNRRERFAAGVVVAGFATVALLFAVNPDRIIARTNLERAAGAAGTFDAAYLATLSADAMPVLLAALPALPQEKRCGIAERLLKRWGPDSDSDVRTWSVAGALARREAGARAEEWRRECG